MNFSRVFISFKDYGMQQVSKIHSGEYRIQAKSPLEVCLSQVHNRLSYYKHEMYGIIMLPLQERSKKMKA